MTRIGAAIAGALLVLLGGCTQQPDAPAARVTREGFSVRDDNVGVAALVRVDDARSALPITVTFTSDGEEVSTEQSELPFCPAETDCWWGESYAGDTLGSAWKSIDGVDVRVGEGATDGDAERRIVELDVVSDGERQAMETSEAGTIYTIVFDDGEPTWGGFATVRRAPDDIGAEGLVGSDERMRAFLYVDGFADAAEPGAD